MLTREEFERLKPTIERIEIPELEDEVCIRTISAKARDAYDNSVNDGERRDFENIAARLVCLCLCDEAGEPFYPDAKEGATAVGEWGTSIVERLFYECRDLNMMGPRDLARAVKNLKPAPDSVSNSD